MQMIVLVVTVLALLVTSDAKPNQPPNADMPPPAMSRGNMVNMQNAGVPRPTDNQDMSRKTGAQQPPLPMVPPPSAVPPPSG
ncbi:hypothetical protein TELCIR_04962 [Teladorsagia circumcincta]|uniref:Uncharacterized protein n=1 Tax=Teladorsagia circumcincta TaxID=45464 RepID=A0A2G9USF5_TELCI|nr:hypothetical protein TELCIR_04962 [Teladorsagia circumcincta]